MFALPREISISEEFLELEQSADEIRNKVYGGDVWAIVRQAVKCEG